MSDLHDWMNFYETGRSPTDKPVFQFGANPEVEDVLVSQGNRGLMVFDDDVSAPAYCRTESWAEGFKYIQAHPDQHFSLVCGVASTPQARRSAVKRIERNLQGSDNWRWGTVIASSAYKAVNVKPAKGVLILDMCYVGPFATLSEHAVMLPGSAIYHNSHLGAFSIMVGGCRVLGRARVDGGTRVCCNAVVLPEAEVGPGSTIGALQSVKRLSQSDWREE